MQVDQTKGFKSNLPQFKGIPLPPVKDYVEEVIIDPNNRFVKSPISRLDDDVIKQIKRSRAGRKRRYTPLKFKNDVNKYFASCEKKDEIPSIKGMCIFLKLSVQGFLLYKNYPEFKELIDYVTLIIDHWVENDIYKTPGQASAKIAYAKNVHSWREKSEVEQVVVNRSVDEARARIEALLPNLLEHIKRQALNQQLLPKESSLPEVVKEELVIEEVSDVTRL